MERGIVVSFDRAKRYGFVRAAGYPKDVFVHESAIVGGGALRVGQRVTFEAEAEARGPRARRVVPGARGVSPGQAGALGLVAVLLGGTLALHGVGPGWGVAWLVAANLATPIVFAWDKHRAVREGRRVPEAVLLGLALIGGSPSAALAMALLRHKTRKRSFLIPFALVLLAQAVAIVLALRRA